MFTGHSDKLEHLKSKCGWAGATQCRDNGRFWRWLCMQGNPRAGARDTNTGLGARSLTRPSLPDLPFPLGMAGLCILVLEGVPWAPTYLSECLPHCSAQKQRNNSCRAPRVLNPTRRAIWPLFCVWWWGILVPVWSICNPLNWVRIITLNHYHNPSSSSNLIIVSIILIIMKG